MMPADRSKYHWPGVPSNSNAFSTCPGSLPTLAGPTRFAVRLTLGNMTRLVELSQQGCAIVIVVPWMLATGQRGSVHEPRPNEPSDHSEFQPVYTNSLSLWFFPQAISEEWAPNPV